MKNLLLSLLFLISFSAFSQGWTLLNPSPTEFDIVSVDFTSADTGYFCTSTQAFRTFDGGASWTEFDLPLVVYEDYLHSVDFIDNNTGFISKNNGCFRTTNAGQTWQFVMIGPDLNIYDLFFLNDSTGFASGTRKSIARTDDAGMTWTMLCVPNPNTEFNFKRIQFLDTLTGYAIAENYLHESFMYETTDGGYNWDLYYLDDEMEDPVCFHAVNDHEMWVGTKESYNTNVVAWHTVNGGYLWNYVELEEDYRTGIMDIEFDGLNGWALNGSHFYSTTDGGITWNTTNLPDFNRGKIKLLGFDMSGDNLTGVAFGECPAIMKTTDNGATFTNLIYGDVFHFNSIFFTDTLTGFVGGISRYGSEINYTHDGGKHWAPASLDTIHGNIADIEFGSSLIGYASHADGFYKTTDGGLTWISMSTGIDTAFSDLSVVDENIIFLAGQYTSVIKSMDGGDTWTDISPGVTGLFGADIVFVDSLCGYLAAENFANNFLFKTNNGGESWTQLGVFPTAITGMDFADSQTGFIGYFEKIYSTHDGGITWQQCSFPDSFWVTYITILDEQTVLAASEILDFAVSYNGGLSFTTVYPDHHSIAFMTDHHFLSDRCGWICGDNGMIRHYGTIDTGLPNIELPETNDPFFYPNPSHTTITLKEPAESTYILNIDGRIVHFQGHSASNTINITPLKPGVYVVISGGKRGMLVKE